MILYSVKEVVQACQAVFGSPLLQAECNSYIFHGGFVKQAAGLFDPKYSFSWLFNFSCNWRVTFSIFMLVIVVAFVIKMLNLVGMPY